MAEKTILVADDQPAVRNVLRTNFKRQGFDVLTANDGASTIEQAKANIPDLILLDLMMPDKDGYEVLGELKADVATKSIPVMIITAHGGAEEVRKAMSQGAQDFVVKPFNLNSLLQKSFKLVYEDSEEAPTSEGTQAGLEVHDSIDVPPEEFATESRN
ncbi:MAG: response regulator [Candidatus Lindowbacteria bacterium]|nr:response regulator [Candidatus Lindowbacteria bacterium]